ncbi:flagellar hook-length control protein FliK [Tateyamaria sp.]|uniref:flagellar hook-length control protein FliK n=1 Tax=Tateyamaria sp. TaxID=1929288 RepID=UPI003B215860
MPTQLAQQMAQILHRNPDRPLEIALNPAELGRVRMTLTASEAGITVNILADRADTLDLMRRNIDDLSQSFSDLGYDEIAFAFGQSGDPADMDGDGDSGDPDAVALTLESADDTSNDIPNTPRLAIVAEGVDIRL